MSAGLLAFLFLLLILNFRFNVFHTVPQDLFRVYQADSQSLSEQKLLEISRTGRLDPARGFLVQSHTLEKLRIEGRMPEADAGDGKIYRSQFGLQGLVGAFIQWSLRTPPKTTISLLETLMAAATAGTIVLLLKGLLRRSGPWVTLVAVVPLIFCPTLVNSGRNLYWALPLIMLPLIVTWILYEEKGLQEGTLKPAFIAVAALVFLKCLCGYEYITCLCLAPAVALTAVWAAGDFRDFPRFFRHCAVLFGAACLGFAVAMVVHFSFVWWAVGDFHQAIDSILERATSHIGALHSQNSPEKYQHGIVGLVLMIIKYLTFPGTFVGARVSVGDGDYTLLSGSFAGLFLFVILFGIARLRSLGDWRLFAGPALVALAGLLASLSWLIAARGHALNHFHLNSMAFLPLLISFPLALFASTSAKNPPPSAES